MLPNLTANEARVIGCLMEKSVVTPDQYPLTLNALVNACNQKSSRDPVMSLERGMVQRTSRELEAKNLVRTQENFKSGVEKYAQCFCNTHFGEVVDIWTWIGAGVIFSGITYITYRERKLAKALK